MSETPVSTLAGRGSAQTVQITLTGRDTHFVITATAIFGLVATAILAAAGLPGANIHGLAHFVGVMDPACGLTRGMYHAGRGEFSTAWQYNPASLPLLAGAAIVAVRAAIGLITHRWVTVRLGGRLRWALFVLGFVAFVLLWVNQQAHAALLIQT